MRYSLVNRVRGTFLGSLLGERLATQDFCDLEEIAVLGSKSLIRLGRLDIDDWLHFYQEVSVNSETGDIAKLKIVLATLPLVVFFHENTHKLKHNLLEVLQIWDTEPVVKDVALVLGYAIAKSLTETLNPVKLISQIVSFLGETTTAIPQKLLKVKILIEEGAGLEQAQTEFSAPELSNNLALALYCFLSSLEDFRLTVIRSQQNLGKPDSGYFHSQITGVLAGALSGAYNGTAGIPVNWQMVLSGADSPVWGQNISAQILKLANDIVAVWSGGYNITPHTHGLTKEECQVNWELTPMPITAAPSVIRPR
ncbi:ADP-ribosylglycohydrolase family protein [Okeanomitos corallinicola TIOX110]|uniref:ADP-ribosylglycohydrolase family protein n=1 Tax=Okeanomitos corallinicola TIOX110 TaxID=3133117 RepID=A0ABZ2V097_9CYAN